MMPGSGTVVEKLSTHWADGPSWNITGDLGLAGAGSGTDRLARLLESMATGREQDRLEEGRIEVERRRC
jgi:hypothetical protein